MLTKRENLIETIRGGKPDRFVKQFEFVRDLCSDPWNATTTMPQYPGDKDQTGAWGVTWSWPAGTPGPFPVHDQGKKVLEDVTEWEKIVKHPPLEYPDELWQAAAEDYAKYDRKEFFVGPVMFPGLFECTHCLMGMENAMISFYEEPEAMHDMINSFVDWETAYVKQMADILHPDAVIHHDDWGSQRSTFFSPDMFDEFFLEPYKRLYGFYRSHGFELIIHHSDSYAATLVPEMIEIGVDIWQGGTKSNDLPSVLKQYGGRISIMSGIDSSIVDKENWTAEEVKQCVDEACSSMGPLYFIPCQTQGDSASTFDGVYDAINEEIDRMSARIFRA